MSANAPERQPVAVISPGGLDLQGVVAALRAVREQWRSAVRRPPEIGVRELPSAEAVARIVDGLRGALFPMRLGPPELRQESEDFFVGHALDVALQSLVREAARELRYNARHAGTSDAGADDRALDLVRDFATLLPGIRTLLDSDVQAAFRGDPAARSVDEVLLCYPGIEAMIHHRLAHQLYRLGAPLIARLVAEKAHGETGIDIHPGARIGAGFFIDHGTGVVIGETAQIGERVRLYQHVTLGARSFPADENGDLRKGLPRHPIVEDEVVVYAGATILGRVTIGRGSVIGGNVWLTRSVPAGSHVTQAQSRQDAGESQPTS